MTDGWEKMTNMEVESRANMGNRKKLGSFLKQSKDQQWIWFKD